MFDLLCYEGDRIIHNGKEMCVRQIIEEGSLKDNTKSVITACPIMDNGQVLLRSPKYIGNDWVHKERN